MNKLQKMLHILGSVNYCHFDILPKIVNIIDSVSIMESEWDDEFKRNNLDMYPLDLSKIDTWSTYDQCVSLTFETLNTKFIKCQAVIYDGDCLNGYPQRVRFTATINIPISFLSEIKDAIEEDFEWYCKDQYKKHLQKVQDDWIRDFQKNLLG